MVQPPHAPTMYEDGIYYRPIYQVQITSKPSMYLTSINRPWIWHILLLDYGMLNWPKKQCRSFTKGLLESVDSMWCTRKSSLSLEILMAWLWPCVVVSPRRPSFEICIFVWRLYFTCLDPCHPGTFHPCIWINIPAIICSFCLVAPVHMN